MKQPLRRRSIVLLSLLCVSVAAPLVLISSLPFDPSPSIAKGKLFGEISGIVKSLPRKRSSDALNLNSIEQENRGLKEPTSFVLKDGKNGGDGSMKGGITLGIPNGTESARLNRSALEAKDVNAGGVEFGRHDESPSDDGKRLGLSNQTTVGDLDVHSGPRSVTNDKINEMENLLIMAKAYLLFTPPNSNNHLVRELKLRIKETERVLARANKDSDLSRTALQRFRAMGATLSKADKAYPDCNAMAAKLRALTYGTEEQLRAQKSQASYLIQLASRTFPKTLHCLSMRLTTEYFNMQPEEREFPNRQKVRNPDLFHYAIFSDNVLACAVVINSTISNSMEPDKIVFHVVTDSLNLPAMTMWFLMNPPVQATIHIESMDEFKWLPVGYSSMFRQPGVRDPRYTSALNHLRFYLPEIFPFLDKVLLLDHDVVVQRDLRELWRIDMKGKINGAVERCREGDSSNRLETLVDFSDRSIAKSFNAKACTWAYGMNMFDLMEWRRQGLISVYHKYLQLGRKHQLWKFGSLPLGQLVFYNHTNALDRRWHALGLGYNPNIALGVVERAAVIHYNGNMKPWLEIGIPKYRGYWSKFLKYDQPYLQQCNIHE